MKITARISFGDPSNRELVIKSFFSKEEFSKNNSIKIENDKMAVIEIVFSDIPPQAIIEAISNCSIESLEYRDEPSDAKQIPQNISETDQKYDSDNDSTVQAIKTAKVWFDDSKDSEGTNVPKRKKRRGRAKPSEADYLDIPELDEFAKESKDYDDFVAKVAKWLEMGNDLERYFCALLMELKKLEQKPYELRVIQIEDITKKVTKKPYEKTKLSKHLTDFLAKKRIDEGTFTPFIITVLKYKYNFSSKEKNETVAEVSEDEEENNPENVVEVSIVEETGKGIIPPPLRAFEERQAQQSAIVKEADEAAETSNKSEDNNNLISNPAFAEIFSKIDKTLPVSEQISVLYSKMGFDASRSLFQSLCRLTMTALSTEHLESIDNVMLEAGIDASTAAGMKVKVKISEMINDYNKANHIKRMKVIAFLREIKSIFSLE